MAEKIHTMTESGVVRQPQPGSAKSARCVAKDMDDLYQPSHRGDCRQGNKLQGIKGKFVVMQLYEEAW